MVSEKILVLIIGFLVSIGVVKFSAQLAYKKPVSWGDAFVQWILLIVLAIVAGFVMDFLQLGVKISEIMNALVKH